MKTSDLIFVGIKGSVVALNRSTGEQIWSKRLKSTDFVNVVVEEDQIFATNSGEIYCLNAMTGENLWHNALKGYGIGLATIAVTEGCGNGLSSAMAEKLRRDEAAAAAAATGTA